MEIVCREIEIASLIRNMETVCGKIEIDALIGNMEIVNGEIETEVVEVMKNHGRSRE